MKTIMINENKYEILNDENNIIDVELLSEKITDYYNLFDYIVGDYAYNKNFKPINDFKNLDKYIKESCAYGCKWFCIKKLKNKD